MSYRCSKCRGRNRLSMKPEQYIRLPKCAVCGRKMTAHPLRRTEPHFVLDRYRVTRERGRGPHLCYPGRGGCNGYHFPHRRGSKFCWHSTSTTDAERQAQWEEHVARPDDSVPF